MKNSIIVLLGIVLYSCFSKRKIEYSNELIFGRWCSTSTMADYPHLTFKQDGYVILDCKIDTILGLKYSLNNDYLILSNVNSFMNKDRILKLTSDSLVFKSLIENKTTQKYFRCN